MEAATHSHHEHHGHHHHHEMPTSGRALDAVALSATLHCLTGCAIGEVLGMVIGTAAGFSEVGTIALAVTLAFLFGYGLTSLPLLRAGMAFSAVVPVALASDTFSIATMEIVDNAIMVAIPGAMEAGLGNVLFWGSMSVALAIAGAFAFPVNRWLIARGKGHVAVHNTGIHGGPSPRVVGAVAAVGFAAVGSDGVGGLHWADLLLFGSVVAAAIGYAEGGLLARELGAWQTISWALVLCLPVMVVLGIVAMGTEPVTAGVTQWAAFAYLAVVSAFVGFFAWYRGLAIGPIAQVSQVQLIQPVLSIAWAVVLLGETLTWAVAAGALVVVLCAGVAVRVRLGVQVAPRREVERGQPNGLPAHAASVP